MESDRQHWLEILGRNQGFADPEAWVSYAKAHGFREVKARKFQACPDCGAFESRKLGQYIHYSTLIELKHCRSCGLGFADTHIEREVICRHFDIAYKDEDYFTQARTGIFDYVARIADSLAPRGGRVIDVGGALGHLLSALRQRRQDLDLMLNDVSPTACRYAQEVHGLQVMCCGIPELVKTESRFEVILLIDALYYEADIRGTWEAIAHLASDSSALVLRIPDRLRAISLMSEPFSLLRGSIQNQTSIPWYNPEHVYVFSKPYLRRRLLSLGFDRLEFLPSPLLDRHGWRGVGASSWFECAQMLHALTGGRLTTTPCFLAVARRGA
jgi:hypothetical protein